MQFLIDVFLFLVYGTILLLLITYTIKFWLMTRSEKLTWVLLEFKVPREVNKSPLATEVAATAFLQSGGVGVNFKRTFLGKKVADFSLEIASFEGSVHFYIRTQEKFKNIIMSNFYSQYPGLEIVQVEDYVGKVFYDHRLDLGSRKVRMWGAEYKLGAKFDSTIEDKKKTVESVKKWKSGEEDSASKGYYELPADFLPIRTYNDFELNKDTDKGEFKVDPMNGIVEWLGSMKKNQYAYYQVLVQDVTKFDGKNFHKTYPDPTDDHKFYSLGDLVKMRFKKMLESEKFVTAKEVVTDDFGYDKTRTIEEKTTEKDENGKEFTKVIKKDVPLTYKMKEGEEYKFIKTSKKESDLNDQQKAELKQIQKKMAKPMVRAYVRIVNLGVDGASTDVQGILSAMKQFEGAKEYGFNNFGIAGVSDPYDYPWQNVGKRKVPWRSEELFESYVERAVFNPHLPNRKDGVDKWADQVLFGYSMGTRNFLRFIWEALFHPFEHPHPTVSTINLEELATIWHLPSKVTTTPGLNRIDSVKSTAPENLPI